MDHLDKEVIESLSEPAKRVFKSLDYRSKQRMLKKAREMAKVEKMKRRKKSRFKKKGIEKWNKGKKVNGEIGTGCSIRSKSGKMSDKNDTKCCSGSSGKSGCMDSTSFDYSCGSYRGRNRSSGWLRWCC